MSETDLVEAWLANKELERLQVYLERGRPLAQTSLEELQRRWVAQMHAWAASARGFDHSEREDIEAELKLRKIEPPRDLAKEAIEALRRQSSEDMAKLLADPSRFARFGKGLTEEIEQFEASGKGEKH